jgi:serine/threonine-protein kinase HipA
MPAGASVSGVQPKLALVSRLSSYTERRSLEDTDVIAKLPSATHGRMPELEELSLRLAQACGIPVVTARLEDLKKLDIDHHYDFGADVTETNHFLVVERFDRVAGGRVHCEDFAQILNIQPGEKYTRTYLDVAAVMLHALDLGEDAVHDLLRRLVVNEMIGNADMHLKNMGVMYPDGRHAVLSPAYDIVGFAAYSNIIGHGLKILPTELLPKPLAQGQKQHLSPAIVRAFCSHLGVIEKPASAAISDAVDKAARYWPAMIDGANITAPMKARLLARVEAHPIMQSWRRRRRGRDGSRPSTNKSREAQ